MLNYLIKFTHKIETWWQLSISHHWCEFQLRIYQGNRVQKFRIWLITTVHSILRRRWDLDWLMQFIILRTVELVNGLKIRIYTDRGLWLQIVEIEDQQYQFFIDQNIFNLFQLSQPGSSFDISYVRLFRTLDTIRYSDHRHWNLCLLHDATPRIDLAGNHVHSTL
jgi:hypothetical protein